MYSSPVFTGIWQNIRPALLFLAMIAWLYVYPIGAYLIHGVPIEDRSAFLLLVSYDFLAIIYALLIAAVEVIFHFGQRFRFPWKYGYLVFLYGVFCFFFAPVLVWLSFRTSGKIQVSHFYGIDNGWLMILSGTAVVYTLAASFGVFLCMRRRKFIVPRMG